MLATFDDARFDSTGPVGDVARRNLFEHSEAEFQQGGRRCPAGREHHPCGEDVLARSREADLPRLFVVECSRSRDRGADEVVGENRRPHLCQHHRRRLTPQVIEVERAFDAPDVQFRVPAKAVQLRDIVPGVGLGIGQRAD